MVPLSAVWGLLFAGTPGAVIGGDVSGGWLFGRCPAAWRGAGRLRSPGAAGRLLLPGGVRRPAPQGPAAPQVGKEPLAAPRCAGLRLAALVSLLSLCAWCPGSSRDRWGTHGQGCAERVALDLMRALYPRSGRLARTARGC